MAAWLARDVGIALFVVAAMTLLLLCIGIHNAWDTVAYLTARPEPAPTTDHSEAPQPETPQPASPGLE